MDVIVPPSSDQWASEEWDSISYWSLWGSAQSLWSILQNWSVNSEVDTQVILRSVTCTNRVTLSPAGLS